MAFSDYNTTPTLNITLGDGTYIGANMARGDVREAFQQIAADGKLLSNQVAALGSPVPGIQGPAGVVTANGGVSTTSWTTEVGATSGYSAMHILSAPTLAYTNSIGGSDKVRADIQVVLGKFTNGPTGHTNYFDTVIGFGLNNTSSWTPLNTAMASASYRIESKFAQGGASDPFAVEFHISMNSTDAASVEFRGASFFIPHLKANWAVYAGVTLRGGQISLTDGSISPDVAGFERVKFDLRPSGNVINLSKNGANRAPGFSWDSNNVYVNRQINAAGDAFVSLPYVSNENFYYFSAPIFMQANAVANAAFAITAFKVQQCLSLPVGAYLDFCVSQSVTAGAANGIWREVNASGLVTNRFANTGAGACVVNIAGSASSALQINGVQVVGARSTGWFAMTGTGSKVAIAAAAAGTASAAYVQAELQGALNRIAAMEARIKAYDDVFFAAGGIGA